MKVLVLSYALFALGFLGALPQVALAQASYTGGT
jgi:hypothetical protein